MEIVRKTKHYLLLVILFTCNAFYVLGQEVNKPSKSIMLILGSADLETSLKRADIGYKLYNSETDFDYIIVSGGCGAHKSSICEATEMKNYLIDKGVPDGIIFKEEKSKNTAQNYCYSRKLKKADGTKIINSGDNLYVVSNHWHAISVAGCLGKEDLTNSKYVIEGALTPSKMDRADYTSIYEKCTSNKDYCESVTWPLVTGSFYIPKKTSGNADPIQYLFVNDRLYTKSSKENESGNVALRDLNLPYNWKKDIDAAFYNSFNNTVYLFKDEFFLSFMLGNEQKTSKSPKPISSLVENLPKNWFGGYIDAAYLNESTKEVYFFKGEEYLSFQLRRNKPASLERHGSILDLVPKWPFTWGQGYLDAAFYNAQIDSVYLHRGQEFITLKQVNGKLIVLNNAERMQLDKPQ